MHTTEGSPEHEDGDDIVIHPSPAVTPGAHARATADTPPPGDVQSRAVALLPPNYGVAASDPPPPSDISMPVVARGDSRRQRPRNDRLSAAPRVPCALARRQSGRGIKGAGAKYANLYGGPFVCILTDPTLRPTKPVTGHKRTLAGLGDVTLQSADIKAANQAVEAASLIALLPYGSASFVIDDAPELVDARSAEENARLMLRVLKRVGASSTHKAASALGQLREWAAINKPDATSLCGSIVTEFLDVTPRSKSVLEGLQWCRDHCGIDIAARSNSVSSYAGRRPCRENDTESFSLRVVLGLEVIASSHPSRFVRGHAAGFCALARFALRYEQASNFVFTGVRPHTYEGEEFLVVVGGACQDKHPDAEAMMPRPVWGILTGYLGGEPVRAALTDMLSDAPDLRCLIRDTDSRSGNPADATAFIKSALPVSTASKRLDASLHAILQMPPIGLSAEEAATLHGHSGKRFLLNLCRSAKGAFSSSEAGTVGRFSGSAAQDRDVVPEAAALQRHEFSAGRLPDVYASSARVQNAFDLLARAHIIARAASLAALRGQPERLPTLGGWGDNGVTMRGVTFTPQPCASVPAISAAPSAPIAITE